MADRMAAEICIGGPISESLVENLCGEIRQQGIALGYSEAMFEPRSATDLLEARNNDGLLALYDIEARYGEFQDLEGFLWGHDIAYTRKSDGKYEHDPVVVEFRPERGLHECTANKALESVIPVKPLRKVMRWLEAAMTASAKKKPKKARKRVKRALKLLTRHMPPELPPLPPLEIVAATPEGKTLADREVE